MTTIEDLTEKFINEENAQVTAVKSLIEVKPLKKGSYSDIELKTDLTENDVKIHTLIDLIGLCLINPSMLKNYSILNKLIEIKERKSLSLNRKSRAEIVSVAKPPEMIPPNLDLSQQNLINKLIGRR